MRIHFYSPNRIEPWDYRNVFETGIGGSETSHVELAIRLAKRGHKVTSYTDLPNDQTEHLKYGVLWTDISCARFTDGDLWIVYRQPEVGKLLPDGCRAWLVCQDVWYPGWRAEDAARFETIFGLCPRHMQYLRDVDPSNSDRYVMSGNGVNVERIEREELYTEEDDADGNLVQREPPERIPHRLIWTSSPDRGLKELLDIFERAKEQVADLELHIFYGMDNIEKICGGDRKKYPWVESWKQYDRAYKMPGVTWRGRIGQQQLTRELLQSGIWCYPTWFQETSCISCMEAQCCGAIPVTNPIWATGYNVKHGVFIEGTPSDRMVMARYVDAVVRIASNPMAQEEVRQFMMPEARKRLSWEVIADQWHALAMKEESVPV